MKKHSDNKIIISIIIGAIIIAGALIFLGIRMSGTTSQKSFAEQLEEYRQQQEQAQKDAQLEEERLALEKAKNVPPITEGDHVYGDKDAEITIYEYSDFECPYCKRFYKIPKQLVDNNKGMVNTVFRNFPLSFHDPLATKEALAAECVANLGGNDLFWKYHDRIFETTNSNGRGMKVSQLTTLAVEVGVNKEDFQTCIDSEKYLNKVEDDISSGVLSGVRGTPGVIIKNNKTGNVKVIPGAVPIESVQEAINDLK